LRNCYFCHGNIINKKIEHLHRWEGNIYLIKNLDAEVCDQCGEVFLSPESIQKIDDSVNRASEAVEFMCIPVLSAN